MIKPHISFLKRAATPQSKRLSTVSTESTAHQTDSRMPRRLRVPTAESGLVLRGRQLTALTRQWGDLLGAGIPLLQTLDVLIGDEGQHGQTTSLAQLTSSKEKGRVALLRAIRLRIARGDTLSTTLRAYPRTFDKRYCQFVTVGEASGSLAKMMRQIADERAVSAERHRQMQQALLYPACVCIMAFIVVVALMVWAVPAFQSLFESFGAPLPALTQLVLAFCATLARWAPAIALCMIISVAALILAMRRVPTIRCAVYARWLAVPVVGRLHADYLIARWGSSVAALLTAGIPLLDALRTVTEDATDPLLDQAMARLIVRLERGETLSGAVMAMKQRSGNTNQHDVRAAGLLFSSAFVTIVQVAEQTGTLERMLAEWSAQLARDTHWRTNEWMRLLEPFVMILCGGWVAILVLSLYLPIIELGNVV